MIIIAFKTLTLLLELSLVWNPEVKGGLLSVNSVILKSRRGYIYLPWGRRYFSWFWFAVALPGTFLDSKTHSRLQVEEIGHYFFNTVLSYN